MVVTIHQPDFLPWLGFFDRWEKSNLYIVLDDVQFLRRGWHHRDRIKTPYGVKWLTVPVLKKGHYFQIIKDVELDNNRDWRRQHLGIIHQVYGRAPNFNRVFSSIKKIYEREHKLLINLNMDLLQFAAEMLGITRPTVFASTFNIKQKKNRRLIGLLKAVNSDIYLTGLGSKDYLDETLFAKEKIKVVWQKFRHPVYPQLYGEFVEKLSVLDYLMMLKDNHLPKTHIDGKSAKNFNINR